MDIDAPAVRSTLWHFNCQILTSEGCTDENCYRSNRARAHRRYRADRALGYQPRGASSRRHCRRVAFPRDLLSGGYCRHSLQGVCTVGSAATAKAHRLDAISSSQHLDPRSRTGRRQVASRGDHSEARFDNPKLQRPCRVDRRERRAIQYFDVEPRGDRSPNEQTL